MAYNTKIPLFRRWVLQNFPFIEQDFDALTDYQLICKVVEYLNKVIENVNACGEQIELLTNAFNQLQDYVNHYFDNLDVQEEINNKLDQMAEDGSLTNLISAYLDPQIEQLNTRLDDFEDDVDTEINDFKTSVNNSISDIHSEVQSIASGAPAGTYATVDALTNADPNHSKIYVVTADGNWYYYNTSTSSWTAGGAYLTNAQDTEDTLEKLNILGFTNLQNRLQEFDGLVNLDYTRGNYTFTNTPWTTNVTNYQIRTVDTLTVHEGDVIGLSDYTGLEYCYAVLKTDNTTAFHDWRSVDFRINHDEDGGTIGIVVRKTDLSIITDPNTIGRKMFIKRYNYELKNDIVEALETPNTVIHNDFVKGTTYYGQYATNNYRAVTYSKHSFDKDVVITNSDNNYKFSIHYINPVTSANVDSGWITGDNASFEVPAGVKFRVLVAKNPEDQAEITDIDAFTASIEVIEKTTNNITTLLNPNTCRYGYLSASGTFEGDQDQVTLTSDFIPLNSDRTLAINYQIIDSSKSAWIGIGFYDEDKTWIKRITQNANNGTNGVKKFFKLPSGVSYIRLSFRNFDNSNVQLNYGYNFGEYVPFELPDTNRRNQALKYNLKSIAHRGWSWSGGAPENTLPAFIEAKAHGFNIVETDIQFSADDVPVCIHDATLERTTNGTGRVIDKTLAQLKELVANAGKEGYPDVKIPTFDEFLKTCRDLELVAYVELKMDNIAFEDFAKYETLMDIVHKYNMEDKVCWLASNYRRLLPIRALDPYARLMLMNFENDETAQINVLKLLHGLFNNGRNTLVYSINHSFINDTYVNLCKEYEIPMEAWTLYSDEQMDALNGYVSGVTSERIPYNLYLQSKYNV